MADETIIKNAMLVKKWVKQMVEMMADKMAGLLIGHLVELTAVNLDLQRVDWKVVEKVMSRAD